jgi:hypothetical protein
MWDIPHNLQYRIIPSSISQATNALLIGFLAGIVLYSIFKSTFGLLMLIPLYMIHRFANDPRAKRAEAVDRQINTRNRKP